METMSKDFMGEYDYPAEEAHGEIESFQGMIEDGYSKAELHQRVIKTRLHWIKAFGQDEQGQADMKRFSEVFNAAMAEKLGVAI